MIRSLLRFFKELLGLRTAESTQLGIGAAELLARFIYEDRHYATTIGRVKPGAFLPTYDGTSVFRIDSVAENEVRSLAVVAGEGRGKPCRARAELLTQVVRDTGLDVVPETLIHPRHANIIGWPAVKHEQKDLANRLANGSSLKLH